MVEFASFMATVNKTRTNELVATFVHPISRLHAENVLFFGSLPFLWKFNNNNKIYVTYVLLYVENEKRKKEKQKIQTLQLGSVPSPIRTHTFSCCSVQNYSLFHFNFIFAVAVVLLVREIRSNNKNKKEYGVHFASDIGHTDLIMNIAYTPRIFLSLFRISLNIN